MQPVWHRPEHFILRFLYQALDVEKHSPSNQKYTSQQSRRCRVHPPALPRTPCFPNTTLVQTAQGPRWLPKLQGGSKSRATKVISQPAEQPKYLSVFMESQNHRMVGVGRALCGSPSPTPCPSRVTQSRLHSTVSRQGLNISREGDSTTSHAVTQKPLSRINHDLFKEMNLDRVNVLSQSLKYFSCPHLPSQKPCCSSRLSIRPDHKEVMFAKTPTPLRPLR